jgi:hypothetical protein
LDKGDYPQSVLPPSSRTALGDFGSRSRRAILGRMIFGRVLGWLIIIAGLVVLGRDILLGFETGVWAPIALGQLWFDIDRSSLTLAQAVVQRYISPVLWDPIIVALLYCWAFVVLLILGAIFLSIFRRRARPRRF